jgi:hypothetical protein
MGRENEPSTGNRLTFGRRTADKTAYGTERFVLCTVRRAKRATDSATQAIGSPNAVSHEPNIEVANWTDLLTRHYDLMALTW